MNIKYASLNDKESLKAQLLTTFCSILDVSRPTLSKWVITTDNCFQAAIKSFKLISITSLKAGTELYLVFSNFIDNYFSEFHFSHNLV